MKDEDLGYKIIMISNITIGVVGSIGSVHYPKIGFISLAMLLIGFTMGIIYKIENM